MQFEQILTEQRGRLGIITLNRPERLNAWTWKMAREIHDAIGAWNQNPGVGAVVMTGAGRSFCAGADIGGWDREVRDGDAGERVLRERPQESYIEFLARSKPVICAINGPCIGVGLTMTLPCDVRIAAESARLSMRFVRVGVIPELASTRLLGEIVGLTQSLELMLSGRIINAPEAGRIGLVNRVVPDDQLLDAALETADEIAFNPTESLFAIKRLVWQNLTSTDYSEMMAREVKEFAAAQKRPEFAEAVRAFGEKRKPDFHRG